MCAFSLLPCRCLACGLACETSPLCLVCRARFLPTVFPGALGPCPICGQPRLAEQNACVDCSTQTWSFPTLDGLYGYQESGGELLRLFKFGGYRAIASLWGPAGASRLFPRGPLVPVPALRRHLWTRGWDPVVALANAISKHAAIPVWKVLTRGSSMSQKSLNRQARTENAKKAYRLHPWVGSRLAGTPLVWLVDDVVTTGATVEACSRLLRDAGVAEVRVFCLGLH